MTKKEKTYGDTISLEEVLDIMAEGIEIGKSCAAAFKALVKVGAMPQDETFDKAMATIDEWLVHTFEVYTSILVGEAEHRAAIKPDAAQELAQILAKGERDA